MTKGLQFRLLGPFSVYLDGVPINRSLTGPAQALLVYLLLHHPHRHRRETLIAQIWDRNETSTRAAFNTALWRLRRYLDGLPDVALVQQDDTLRLSLSAPASCDAMHLMTADTSDATMCNERRNALRLAVSLWRGPYAEGLDHHWVLAARERFHSAYITALTTLMRDAGDTGQYEMALDYGQRILAADPFREAVHCEMLWLWVLTGQRVRAIRAHKRFCALLRDELDIGPMAETTALFDYICDGLERASISQGMPAQQNPPARQYQGYIAALAKQRSQIYATLREQLQGMSQI